uniref:TSA: Wollemia nobilis Ref_Wollemi_Transcript_12801_2370 transcribed RNA sequence n=1 Tax=Wollemia nobilis TaxID=56998 RepID=A0A0C9RL46_9CONI
MEAISSAGSLASSGKLFTIFNIPKSSSSYRHQRRLAVSNVKTDPKPETTIFVDRDKPSTASEFKPTLKTPKVQTFEAPDLPFPRPWSVVVCSAVDDFINNFVDKPLRPSVDPKYVLAGNFAPVGETPPTKCPRVKGTLPACLNGVYLRNGPNPRLVPRSGYHLFDGDGMLHAVRIKNGRVTYCSRFVRTYKFVQEEATGSPVFPNIFSGFYSVAGLGRAALVGARVAFGLYNPLNGAGLANTSVLHFDRKLMALGESDLPYVVRVTGDGDIQTVGRYDFEGKLFMGMTAHPKVDPETGELFAFRYGPVPPFLNYFRVSAGGEKEPDVGILSMPRPSFIHDFAITKRYAVFTDTQIVVKPLDMVLGDGAPIGCDTAKVPRLGVLPRYATDDSEMRWFEVPGFNFIHALNAWDESEEVVLIAPNTYPFEHVLERTELVQSTVEKLRLNLATGTVAREPLSSLCLEFGVVNPRFVGRRNRYAYMSIGAPLPKIGGVVKLDFERARRSPEDAVAEDCVVASRLYGPGRFGSEPFFVPRTAEPDADEDDGYVVQFTHEEGTGASQFVVMDARSPTLEVVASVELPGRVPYGFHGLFVSEKDLASTI